MVMCILIFLFPSERVRFFLFCFALLCYFYVRKSWSMLEMLTISYILNENGVHVQIRRKENGVGENVHGRKVWFGLLVENVIDSIVALWWRPWLFKYFTVELHSVYCWLHSAIVECNVFFFFSHLFVYSFIRLEIAATLSEKLYKSSRKNLLPNN